MSAYIINISREKDILLAKSQYGTMKINLSGECYLIVYNDIIIIQKNVAIDDMHILYLACALRKVIFDYHKNYPDILTHLRTATASYPIPNEIEIIYTL